MLGPGLSNLQKINNLATCVNLLNMFATLIPNAGPHVLQKGPGEGVIYLQISGMLKFSKVSFEDITCKKVLYSVRYNVQQKGNLLMTIYL